MAFDIAMQVPRSTVKLASEIEADYLQNEAKKMQNALTAQEMDIRGADMEAQKNFNALMDQAGGDYNKALEMAPDWRTKELIGGKISQRQAAQQDEQLKQFDRGMKEIEFGARIMGTVKDQASYDMARQRMAQYGLKVESMPANYDPNYVDSMVNSAMSFKDRIAQQKLEYEARRIEQGDQRLGLMEQRLMQQSQGGGVDTTKGWTIKETANGLVRVNEYTGAVEPVQMDGQTLQGKPSASAVNVDRKMMQEAVVADKDYQNSLDAAQQADKLLNTATGSTFGRLRDQAYATVGESTEGAKSAAQLKVVAGKLVAAVPKFSGPQSDADVKLYREMAGQVGDENLPTETRRAALQTVIELQKAEADRRKAALNLNTGYNSLPSAPAAPTSPNVSNW